MNNIDSCNMNPYDINSYPSNIFDVFKQSSLENSKYDDDKSLINDDKSIVSKINIVTNKEEDDFGDESTKRTLFTSKPTEVAKNRNHCQKFSDKKKNYSFCSNDKEISEKTAKSVVSNPYVSTKNPETAEIITRDGSICTDVTSSTSKSAGLSTESPNASKADALNQSWKDIAQHSSAKPRKNNITPNNVTPPICSDKDVDRIDKSATDDEDVNSSNDELKTVGSINSVILDISLHPDAEQDLKKKPYFAAIDSIYNESMKTNLNRVSFVGKTLLSSDHARKRAAETMDIGMSPIEITMNSNKYCKDCNQLCEFCHRRVYSDYIKKKVFFEYANITVQPKCDDIIKTCEDSYNEIRRVSFHQKFNFYDGAEQDLPPCLYAFSWELVHMIEEIIEGAKINSETKDGIIKLIAAKRLRKAS